MSYLNGYGKKKEDFKKVVWSGCGPVQAAGPEQGARVGQEEEILCISPGYCRR
jgi:hypothetical protein